ncbi:MAG: prephenate dehydrogenase/arogenate dehydrogenase family protein [Planctomycetota bacterium]|jgi:prephenate dehydrogenase|nr:prephenate dehydrogenase/arogenate dehydrogenase family protein [Planctomycetota bacterium]
MKPFDKSLGIVGFGAFGCFMAAHLAPWFRVTAWDSADIPATALPENVTASPTIAEVAACDIVVFAVPWKSLADAAAMAAPHMKPEALALDVTSVKRGPAALLPKALPAHVDILCTHPLFGPQSGKNGISGLRMALCPVRIEKDRYYRVCDFLTDRLGLLVFKTTPDKHDREMAKVQAVTHFVSRALKEIGLEPSCMATRAYEKLQEFSSIVLSDSWDLFLTIQNGNPYAAETRRSLQREMDKLEAMLRAVDGPVREPMPPPYAAAW